MDEPVEPVFSFSSNTLEEKLARTVERWERRIEDLNKEFEIAKAAGRWQHVIELEAYAVELMARRNEIRDLLR